MVKTDVDLASARCLLRGAIGDSRFSSPRFIRYSATATFAFTRTAVGPDSGSNLWIVMHGQGTTCAAQSSIELSKFILEPSLKLLRIRSIGRSDARFDYRTPQPT